MLTRPDSGTGRRRLANGTIGQMRIAVDARPFTGPRTGAGRVLEGLLGAWASIYPDDELVLLSPSAVMVPDGCRGRVSADPAGPALPGTVWLQTAAPLRAIARRANAFLASLAIVPLASPLPCVALIHDLTPLLEPEWHHRRNVLGFNPLIGASVRRAGRLAAVSETTRRDLLRWFPESEGKTVTIPNGLPPLPDPAPAGPEPPEGTDPYVLYLSTLEPRKNVERLLEAMECLWDRDTGFPGLVLAGGLGWGLPRLPERLRRSRHAARIRWLGHVSPEVSSRLLRHAEVLAYPSLYEGFGLPPLEAMAVGTVVVASSAGSLPEVMGDAGLLPDPRDVSAIARALTTAVRDEPFRHEARRRGLQRAALYSWRSAAVRMRCLFEELLAS